MSDKSRCFEFGVEWEQLSCRTVDDRVWSSAVILSQRNVSRPSQKRIDLMVNAAEIELKRECRR